MDAKNLLLLSLHKPEKASRYRRRDLQENFEN
jgi:hypothetical protein